MVHPADENEMLTRLVHWGEAAEPVRAMILTSSRANPNARVDIFSDYDVILVVEDIHPYFNDRDWLEDFGPVLVVYRDPIQLDLGCERFAYITQYEDGSKIDFILAPLDWLHRVAAVPQLPEDLDVGYRVLLDKDQLTAGLKSPSHRAYIPTPPAEAEYQQIITEFFHEATYVVKHLWRDDLMPAKYNLDYAMKHVNLRQMLVWRMEMDHGWAVKPGAYGKGLKALLSPELWAELESTYVGASLDENWEALYRTMDLFRKAAVSVGDHLGYAYPHELDRRCRAYTLKVQEMYTARPGGAEADRHL